MSEASPKWDDCRMGSGQSIPCINYGLVEIGGLPQSCGPSPSHWLSVNPIVESNLYNC